MYSFVAVKNMLIRTSKIDEIIEGAKGIESDVTIQC